MRITAAASAGMPGVANRFTVDTEAPVTRKRPKGDRITGSERADVVRSPACCGLACPDGTLVMRGSALRRIELKLNDALGRNRPQVVRIEHVQQRLGDFREFVVQLVVHPPGTEARTLRSAARRADRRSYRAPSSRRPRARGTFPQTRRHLTNERQLALVVGQQFVSHEFPPETANARDSRCKVTSNTTGSPGVSDPQEAPII